MLESEPRADFRCECDDGGERAVSELEGAVPVRTMACPQDSARRIVQPLEKVKVVLQGRSRPAPRPAEGHDVFRAYTKAQLKIDRS